MATLWSTEPLVNFSSVSVVDFVVHEEAVSVNACVTKESRILNVKLD